MCASFCFFYPLTATDDMSDKESSKKILGKNGGIAMEGVKEQESQAGQCREHPLRR